MKKLILNLAIAIFTIAAIGTLGSCSKEGCMDEEATNYDETAKTDDGSCEYVEGCTDETATNYDANAVKDDGSCEYVEGCTDPTATNYNPDATVDDGSCEYAVVDPCGAGIAFCMDFGGTTKSGDASLIEYAADHYRVYWTTGTGATYEQVELDIYGAGAGTYTIDGSGAAGTANFQYFGNSVAEDGTTGSVIITEWDLSGNGVTGTFSTTTDAGTDVSDGNIYQVNI